MPYSGAIVAVSPVTFLQCFREAAAKHPHADALGDGTGALADGARCFLTEDGFAGYVLQSGGDLQSVFSSVRGRGDLLVRHAVANGARTLDCFDGYLPTLYARHGFREVRREANWTDGGPDVVFFRLPDGSGCPNWHGCGADHAAWRDCP
jgi:hypothetical protein